MEYVEFKLVSQYIKYICNFYLNCTYEIPLFYFYKLLKEKTINQQD